MTKRDRKRILKALAGRTVRAHALTHAHPDHQGSSHAVCEALGVPLWVGEEDVAAAEDPRLIEERQPDHPINALFAKVMTGPGHPVDRVLREGTTSPASPSSTSRATPRATSRSGGRRTGRSSPATC